jgi:hypothetical protein
MVPGTPIVVMHWHRVHSALGAAFLSGILIRHAKCNWLAEGGLTGLEIADRHYRPRALPARRAAIGFHETLAFLGELVDIEIKKGRRSGRGGRYQCPFSSPGPFR